MIVTKCNYEGKESTYPMLKYMKINTDLVVGLFDDPREYIVVYTTLPSIWKLGSRHSIVGKLDSWNEYDGTVTLSND